jgi:hypothetical protein
MRRRGYVAMLASAATGGCLSTGVPSRTGISRSVASFTRRGHPYENEVLTVSLDTDPEGSALLRQALETATTYWETHAPRFADFPVSYSIEPDAETPDVAVEPVAQIDHCGKHTDSAIAGCAPRVTAETVRPATATIQIETDLTEPFLTRILKHEFGHTLGLDHDDEPRHVMSSDPETWVPQYERRRQIVDDYVAAVEEHNAAVEAYNDGTDRFNETAFAEAIDRYEASVAAVKATVRRLDRVISTAQRIDADAVVDNARTSRETIGYLGTAAEYLTQAASAHEQGAVIDGKRYRQKHDAPYDAFREGTFHPASTIVRLLGVPANA